MPYCKTYSDKISISIKIFNKIKNIQVIYTISMHYAFILISHAHTYNLFSL